MMERRIQYFRHEFRYEPEAREAPLSAFLFDIPNLGACGVFPPLHLLNQRLRSGGGDGGMSPGASWEPFEITEAEYKAILNQVLNPDLKQLKHFSRYSWQRFILDPAFDGYQDYWQWFLAVCQKHRDSYHQYLRSLQEGK